MAGRRDAAHPQSSLLSMPASRAVATLAAPMVVAGLLRSAYFLTDTVYLGRLGSDALAAAGGGAFAWWIIAQLAELPGLGVRALVAQREGAGEGSSASAITTQGLWVGACVWALLLCSIPLTGLYFDALGFSDASPAHGQGIAFLDASLGGALSLIAFGVMNAAFQGAGDTKTGMYIAAFSVAMNAALDPILIWGFGPIPPLGIAGAAWSTCACNVGGVVIGGLVMRRRGMWPSLVGPDLQAMKAIARIGTPVTIAGVGFSLIYVALGRVITPFGEDQMAGLGVGHRLESLAYMVCMGFSVGATTLVGQYVGAGDLQGARRAGHVAAAVCCGLMVPIGVVLFAFGEEFVGWLTSDQLVSTAAVAYIKVQAIVQVWMAMESVYEGAFTGLGDTMPTFWVTTVGTVARIPLAVALAHHAELGVMGVWYAVALTTVVKGTVLWAWFHRRAWG